MIQSEEVQKFVSRRFSRFGVNKKREITRLLYEIAKRDGQALENVLPAKVEQSRDYSVIRNALIAQRYPFASQQRELPGVILPGLDIDKGNKVSINRLDLNLHDVFVEKDVISHEFVQRLKSRYPQARYHTIEKYASRAHEKKLNIKGYNERLTKFYIINEEYDFFKSCACSKKSVHCGYHVVNLGSGCAFECEYCYLQDYINSPGIVLPANLEDFFHKFKSYKQDIHVGSGEITDSLVFDHITEYSPKIVNFFRGYPESRFEFKTKSDNVNLLFNVEPAKNIVVSWSVNPPAVIKETEHYTAPLAQRLSAAKRCADAGYTVAFHLDPVIHYAGWKKDYIRLVEQIFDAVKESRIGWISVGTLRMTLRLKKIIENRFPGSSILDEEFFVGYDGKLRYSQQVRNEIYTTLKREIQKYSKDLYVYLCMEEKTLCESAQMAPVKPYRKERS